MGMTEEECNVKGSTESPALEVNLASARQEACILLEKTCPSMARLYRLLAVAKQKITEGLARCRGSPNQSLESLDHEFYPIERVQLA